VARDRKRAKQRRERRGNGRAGRTSEGARAPAPGNLTRADLPGALDHAGAEVDEFDAALVRGAGGVTATPDTEAPEVEAPEELPGVPPVGAEDALQLPPSRRGPGGGDGGGGGGAGGAGGGDLERPSGAPLRGNRAVAFVRASWAELQRVQWPDRRHVFQATAVVLGFVAVAGAYLGLADYVAKEIVELVLG